MKSEKKFINSLSRGLSVLSLVSESSSPLTLTELSNHLQLRKSTVQRLTYTLQHLKYLQRDLEAKTYRLGPNALSIGLSAMRSLDLRNVAPPILKEASKEIGETVNLAILDGSDIVYIERIKTEQIVNINLHVGSRLPAYCTSMGKAILAFLPREHSEKVLKTTKLNPVTPYTINSKTALREELRKVRERGFSTNNEELSIGLKSVAAPVRNYKGEVIAAVNIAIPSIRAPLEKLETFFAEKVIDTANRISLNLGYKKNLKSNPRIHTLTEDCEYIWKK